MAAGNFASIVAVGEILWDLLPDGRRLGGAPLNFSAHARHLGHPVSLISALGGVVLGADGSPPFAIVRPGALPEERCGL